MTHYHVLIIAFVTWLIWLPAIALDKKARGDMGSISIFPEIPFFPLAAWGLAFLCTQINFQAGIFTIGCAHLLLLAAFLFSIIRSKRAISHQQKVKIETPQQVKNSTGD